MSTKCTIKHGKGFHLYRECYDEHYVYLSLGNTAFTAELDEDGRSYITVAIENDIAKKLGFLNE